MHRVSETTTPCTGVADLPTDEQSQTVHDMSRTRRPRMISMNQMASNTMINDGVDHIQNRVTVHNQYPQVDMTMMMKKKGMDGGEKVRRGLGFEGMSTDQSLFSGGGEIQSETRGGVLESMEVRIGGRDGEESQAGLKSKKNGDKNKPTRSVLAKSNDIFAVKQILAEKRRLQEQDELINSSRKYFSSTRKERQRNRIGEKLNTQRVKLPKLQNMSVQIESGKSLKESLLLLGTNSSDILTSRQEVFASNNQKSQKGQQLLSQSVDFTKFSLNQSASKQNRSNVFFTPDISAFQTPHGQVSPSPTKVIKSPHEIMKNLRNQQYLFQTKHTGGFSSADKEHASFNHLFQKKEQTFEAFKNVSMRLDEEREKQGKRICGALLGNIPSPKLPNPMKQPFLSPGRYQSNISPTRQNFQFQSTSSQIFPNLTNESSRTDIHSISQSSVAHDSATKDHRRSESNQSLKQEVKEAGVELKLENFNDLKNHKINQFGGEMTPMVQNIQFKIPEELIIPLNVSQKGCGIYTNVPTSPILKLPDFTPASIQSPFAEHPKNSIPMSNTTSHVEETELEIEADLDIDSINSSTNQSKLDVMTPQQLRRSVQWKPGVKHDLFRDRHYEIMRQNIAKRLALHQREKDETERKEIVYSDINNNKGEGKGGKHSVRNGTSKWTTTAASVNTPLSQSVDLDHQGKLRTQVQQSFNLEQKISAGQDVTILKKKRKPFQPLVEIFEVATTRKEMLKLITDRRQKLRQTGSDYLRDKYFFSDQVSREQRNLESKWLTPDGEKIEELARRELKVNEIQNPLNDDIKEPLLQPRKRKQARSFVRDNIQQVKTQCKKFEDFIMPKSEILSEKAKIAQVSAEREEWREQERKIDVKIDNLEQFAMLRLEDVAKLHKILQYRLPMYQKIKAKKVNLLEIVQNIIEKKVDPAEQEYAEQLYYHQIALTFLDKRTGKMLTEQQLKDMKQMLELRVHRMKAAKANYSTNQVTYDSIADFIFQTKDKDQSTEISDKGESGENQTSKIQILEQVDEQEQMQNDYAQYKQALLTEVDREQHLKTVKGLSLLLRKDTAQTKDEINYQFLMIQIKEYLESLESTNVNRESSRKQIPLELNSPTLSSQSIQANKALSMIESSGENNQLDSKKVSQIQQLNNELLENLKGMTTEDISRKQVTQKLGEIKRMNTLSNFIARKSSLGTSVIQNVSTGGKLMKRDTMKIVGIISSEAEEEASLPMKRKVGQSSRKSFRFKFSTMNLLQQAGLQNNTQQSENLFSAFPTGNFKDHFKLSQEIENMTNLVKFYQLWKDMQEKRVLVDNNADDPTMIYLQHCMDKIEVILPVINKVDQEGQLILRDYHLNQGHCLGLGMACEIYPQLLKSIYIDNCGIEDVSVGLIMKGLGNLWNPKTICLKRVGVGRLSIQNLFPILKSFVPNNLEELRIEHCRVSKDAMNLLCEQLSVECYLRKLSLVEASLGKKAVDFLAKYVRMNKYLQELDISDNNLHAKDLLLLLQALSKNRRLKYLNLSKNTLVMNISGPVVASIITGDSFQTFENKGTLKALNSLRAKQQEIMLSSRKELEKADQKGKSHFESKVNQDKFEIKKIQECVQESDNDIEPIALKSSQISDEKKSQLYFGEETELKQLDQLSEIATSSESISEGSITNNSPLIRKSKMPYLASDETSNTNTDPLALTPKFSLKTQHSQLTLPRQETDMFSQGEASLSQVDDLKSDDQIICQYLCEFVSANKVLQHLDISICGLQSDFLLQITQVVKKSYSLVAVHMGGNPGNTNVIAKRITKTLNAAPEKNFNHLTFKQFLKASQKNKNMGEAFELMQQGNSIQESMVLKRLKAEKIAMMPADDGMLDFHQGPQMILTRKLGHEIDILGSSQWKLCQENRQQCWVCDHKQYTIFFWSPEFGILESQEAGLTLFEKEILLKVVNQERLNQSKRNLYNEFQDGFGNATDSVHFQQRSGNKRGSFGQKGRISSMEMQDQTRKSLQKEEQQLFTSFDTIPSITAQLEYKKKLLRQKGPFILGGFNNWQPQPMLKVQDIAKALDDPIDFLSLVQRKFRFQIRSEVKKIEDMNPNERQIYDDYVQEYNEKYKKLNVWQSLFMKMIKYKSTVIVGQDAYLKLKSSQLYFAAAFCDLGTQNYLVSYNRSLYYHRTFIRFRKEEIPPFERINQSRERIERNANVFAAWIPDREDTYGKLLEFDYNNSKLPGILKDADVNQFFEFMEPRYFRFKDLWLTVTISSNFPYLTREDFTRFCKQIELFDKTITQSRLDFIFNVVKANKSKENQKSLFSQSKNDFNRFEFLEALVLVALAKYRETGEQKNQISITEAVERLFTDYIDQKFECAPWQSFRANKLWTREVNLTFEANIEPLRELYQILVGENKVHKLQFERAVQFLCNETKIKLHKKDAIYCFAMSLSTCVDLIKHTNQKLLHQTFEEFLEMIARAAEIHFHDSQSEDLPLYQKILVLLEEYLGYINETALPPKWYEDDD